jgi:hypothetical protein
MRKLLPPIVACVLLLGLAGVADACPGCKDSVAESSVDGGPGGPTPALPSGFNSSIYVMLGGLFSVLGLVAGIIVKGVRSADGAAPRGFPVSPEKSGDASRDPSRG